MDDLELVKCKVCGWEGTDEELESDFYDQYTGANDCYLCPNCKNEFDENI